jgi:hypothetical protein
LTDANRGIGQAESIGRLVRAYAAGQASFPELVQGIDLEIGMMGPDTDPSWVEEFRTTWGGLEIVMASMLDEGREEMTDGEVRVVRDTVDSLLAMTEPY